MNCTASKVSLGIALCFLTSSIILGILYLIYIDMGFTDNKLGEAALYLFAIFFLACMIRTNIKDEEKNPAAKVTPVVD
jgi:hypothetical protein